MRYVRWALSGLAAMVVLLGGCASSNDGPISGLSTEQAAEMNAKRGGGAQDNGGKEPELTADTRYAAGQFAEMQGAPALAINQYKEALKLDAGHVASLYRMGVLYAQLRNYPESIATWQEYVKRTPFDASGLSNLAYTYELAGKPGEAEETYRLGVQKDGKNQACRVNYGLMLARHGRITEATMQLQAVLSEAEVHYNLGSAFEQLGQRDTAKAEYRKAIEADASAQAAKARLAALE